MNNRVELQIVFSNSADQVDFGLNAEPRSNRYCKTDVMIAVTGTVRDLSGFVT